MSTYKLQGSDVLRCSKWRKVIVRRLDGTKQGIAIKRGTVPNDVDALRHHYVDSRAGFRVLDLVYPGAGVASGLAVTTALIAKG